MFNQLSNQVENKKSWLIVLTTQHLNDSNSVFQKLQTSKQKREKKYFKWRQIWSKDGDGHRQKWLGDEVGRAKKYFAAFANFDQWRNSFGEGWLVERKGISFE